MQIVYHPYFQKCEKVVKSCVTEEQLEIAKIYCIISAKKAAMNCFPKEKKYDTNSYNRSKYFETFLQCLCGKTYSNLFTRNELITIKINTI